MKKTLFAISAIAVLLGFTACTSENETLEPQVSGKTILKAYTEEATRTALSGNDTEGYKVVWSTGDIIKIGENIFTLTAGAETTSGTFEGATLTTGTEYTAYYPVDYDGTNWPTAQTYTEGNITGSPMKATFTYVTDRGPSLSFKNEGGILRLNLKLEEDDAPRSVKKIVVSSSQLDKDIELNCATAVALTKDGVPFHIAMPAKKYTDLKFNIYDDGAYKYVRSLSTGNTLAVVRSKITTINLKCKDFKPTISHAYVDLGLSVKWATCNVGASSPEDYGDHYAWGETEAKSTYDWGSYKWGKGSENTMTKYFYTVDNKTWLESSDDVAHVKWGGNWRMPTGEEMIELYRNCTWEWTTNGGTNGYKVTSKKNGNSIFLPAAGYCRDNWLWEAGSYGYYWSSSLNRAYYAYCVYFYVALVREDFFHARYVGQSVRPVCP